MAYSPCPKCQTKAQFSAIFNTMPESEALDHAAFVTACGGGYFSCDTVREHEWTSEEALLAELKAAGFLNRADWLDIRRDVRPAQEAVNPVPVRKPMTYGRGAVGLLFDILFPESENFRNHLSPDARHVICRAMEHLSGDVKHSCTSSYPSIDADGDLVPVSTWSD